MIYADHKLIQNLKIEQTKEPRGSTEQNKTRIKRTHKKKKRGGILWFFLERKSLDLLFQIGLLEEDRSQTDE